VFRLRHTSVSGFPRCGLIAACLALRLTPPSSNRTCGFPASGSPESSRLKHSRQAVTLRLAFWLSRALHPQFQVRKGAFAQAELRDSRLRHTSSKAPSLHGHYPASLLLWASPTPTVVRLPVMSSLRRLAPQWVSQVPVTIFRRTPSPYTPERPAIASSRFFTAGFGLHHLRKVGHAHLSIEAGSGSLTLWLTSLPLEASPRLITLPCARLATCTTRNLHGELLSVHWIVQALPGAPQ
jgi:hypothetical protein